MTRSTSMPDAAARLRVVARSRASPCRCGCAAASSATPRITTMLDRHADDVDARERDRAEAGCCAGLGARQLVGAAADEELEGVAQREREADAHDHQLHDARALVVASGLQRPASSARPSSAAEDDRRRDREPDRPAPRSTPKTSATIGAEGHHLAVGEVGEPGRAEDQREADRGEREQQAEVEAVDEAHRATGRGSDVVTRSPSPRKKLTIFVFVSPNSTSCDGGSSPRRRSTPSGRVVSSR